MLGHIIEWFYADLAGIACDPAGPGFKKIIIRPQPVGGITWVKAAYDSAAGHIASDWAMADGKFTLHLEIPVNTIATVYLPANNRQEVFESGRHAAKAPGVRYIRQENNRVIYEVKAGTYEFVSLSFG